MERGVTESGPYQSPMEDGMQHFHEWYRSKLDVPPGSTDGGSLDAVRQLPVLRHGRGVKLASTRYSTSRNRDVPRPGRHGAAVRAHPPAGHVACARPFPRDHLWRSLVGVLSLWLWFYAIAQAAAGHRRHPQLHGADLDRRLDVLHRLVARARTTRMAAGARHRHELRRRHPGAAAGRRDEPVAGRRSPPGLRPVLRRWPTCRCAAWARWASRNSAWCSIFRCTTGWPAWSARCQNRRPAAPFHALDWHGAGLLLAIGVTALLAQMAMTRAYRIGKVLVVANLQYTGIIFSSLWSMLLWGDRFDWHVWLGMAVILVSGIAATFYNTRKTARGAVVETRSHRQRNLRSHAMSHHPDRAAALAARIERPAWIVSTAATTWSTCRRAATPMTPATSRARCSPTSRPNCRAPSAMPTALFRGRHPLPERDAFIATAARLGRERRHPGRRLRRATAACSRRACGGCCAGSATRRWRCSMAACRPGRRPASRSRPTCRAARARGSITERAAAGRRRST